MSECYCGRELRKVGFGWEHASGDPVYCYPEEAGLDDDSRCMADLDPDAVEVSHLIPEEEQP